MTIETKIDYMKEVERVKQEILSMNVPLEVLKTALKGVAYTIALREGYKGVNPYEFD